MASLEERVLEIEVWKRDVTADLYGREGTTEPGLVKHYWEGQAEHRGQRKLWTAFVAVVGVVQILLGAIIAAKQLHLMN